MKSISAVLVVLLASAGAATRAFADLSGHWNGNVSMRVVTEIDSNNTQGQSNFTQSQTKSETVITYDVDGAGPGTFSIHASYLSTSKGHEEDTFQCFKGGKGTQTTDTSMNMTGVGDNSGTVPAAYAAVNLVDNHDGTYAFSLPGLAPAKYTAHGQTTTTSSASCDRKPYNHSDPLSANDSAGVPSVDIIGTVPSGSKSTDTLSGTYSHDIIPGVEKLTATWSLTRAPSRLKAKTTQAVYTVQRGDKVTLDASPSVGAIDEYDWLLAPGVDCLLRPGVMTPATVPVVQMKGKTITFTALCGLYASLTVKSGNSSSAAMASVSVTPRTGWKTTITPPSATHGVFAAGFVKENAFLGKNRCTLDTVEDSSHWLHTSKTGTWEGDGYTLTKISEPGAPFDGFWYVSAQNLRISRMSMHSSALLKGGVLSALNSGKNGNPADLATLLAQVDAHEDTHTILVQEYFAQKGANWDPAAQLEGVFMYSHGDATTNADFTVRSAESELDGTDWETLVGQRLMTNPQFNRSGWIKVPTLGGADQRWNISSFATLQSAAEGIPDASSEPPASPPPSSTASPAPVQLGAPPVTVPLTGETIPSTPSDQ